MSDNILKKYNIYMTEIVIMHVKTRIKYRHEIIFVHEDYSELSVITKVLHANKIHKHIAGEYVILSKSNIKLLGQTNY